MNPVQPDDEELARWLARHDEAIAAGRDTSDLDDVSTPVEFDGRLERDLRCIRLLRNLWGNPKKLGAPSQIGRFEIIRELGRGGFGVVFLAYDPQLHREVALKVPRADVLVTASLRIRFQHEGRAAAGLDHPNIVPVHEAGEVSGICYIASAYCPGPTLAQWLKRRTEPVSIADAARLTAALADGVQHAHSRGVLHRDLKPSNVLMDDEKSEWSANVPTSAPQEPPTPGALRPRITDFGLAKLLVETDASQTHSGALMGTPSYMAPEQATGRTRDVSTAIDIHALGAILYVLLTGRPPFQGESTMETLRRVESDSPDPPGRWRAQVPRDLETICLKCLEKEPSRRYASAAALAEDLRRFLNHEPVAARPVGTSERLARWCRRKPTQAALSAALILVAAVGAGGILSQWMRANRSYQLAEGQRSLAEQRRLKAHEAIQLYFTLVSENKLLGKPGLHELRRDLLVSALEYFQEFLAEESDDRTLSAEIADAEFRVGLIQWQIGSKEVALAALERALRLYDALALSNPANSELPRKLATTRVAIGELELELGKNEHALRSLQDALALQQQLARASGDLPDLLADVARTATLIAAVHRGSGHHDEAMRWLDRAKQLFSEIADANPGRLEFLSDLADTLTQTAAIESDRDQIEAALTTFDLARRTLLQLADARPADSQFRFDLVEVHRGIAGLHFKTGDHAQAIRSIEEGLRIAEQLVHDNPMVTDFMWSLARCYTTLARSQTEIHEFDQAIRNHLEARPILRKLIRLNPTTPDYLSALAANYVTVGHNQFFLGRPTEALASFEEALKHQTDLVAAFPDRVLYRRTLGVILHNFGNESRKIGRRDVARTAWEQCRTLREQLAADNPDMPELQDDVVWIYNKLGSFFLDEDLDEAQRFFEMALTISQQLVAAHPNLIKYERNLSTCLINVAEVQLAQNAFDSSRENYVKAAAIRARIADEHPTLIDVDHDYAKSLRYLGELHLKTEEYAEALRYFERACEAYNKAMAANPQHLDVRSGFGRTWDGMAQSLARLDRPGEALSAYTHAIDHQRFAYTRAQSNTQYRTWLGEHLAHLAQFHRDQNRHADAEAVSAELNSVTAP